MVDLSDDTLMAYADGELDASLRSELDAELAGRPDLVARVALFKRTRHDVQAPFDAILNQPAPADLVASIRSAPIGGSNVSPFRRPAGSRSYTGPSSVPGVWKYTAIAASIGLLVGCASGWYAGASTKPATATTALVADAGIRALGSVRTALETGGSGVAAVIEPAGGQEARITPVATFRSKDDRFCRHYELTAGTKYEGVACRNANGAWDILYHGKVAAKAKPGGLIPAAGVKLPIDSAIDDIIDGGVFDAPDELKAIRDGWKRQR